MNEIFCYHEERRQIPPGTLPALPRGGMATIPCLLTIDHVSKQATFYPVGNLQAVGWKVTADDLRRALPRFQPTPTIVAGNDKSVKQAIDFSQRRAAFQGRLRSGR